MTRFDDNLWRELRKTYGPELSEAAGPLRQRSRLRAPVIAGTSVGVLGAGAAAVVVLTAANSSPAFAVTPHRDGTVSVTIRRIEGIPGANRRLAELGIRARAVRVADGCRAPAAPPLARLAVMTLARDARRGWVGVSRGALHASIRPAQIPSGRTLIIPAIRAGRRVQLVHGRAVPGAIPACLRPAVQIQASPTRGGLKIVTCRGGVIMRRPSPAPGTATDTTGADTTTTATAASPAPVTPTETAPAPATTSAGTSTNTNSESGTATNADSTTAGTSTNGPTPAGPSSVTVPPPLLRACLLAAQAATR